MKAIDCRYDPLIDCLQNTDCQLEGVFFCAQAIFMLSEVSLARGQNLECQSGRRLANLCGLAQSVRAVVFTRDDNMLIASGTEPFDVKIVPNGWNIA